MLLELNRDDRTVDTCPARRSCKQFLRLRQLRLDLQSHLQVLSPHLRLLHVKEHSAEVVMSPCLTVNATEARQALIIRPGPRQAVTQGMSSLAVRRRQFAGLRQG